MDRLVIRGAKQHNLKGFDLELPRNELVVITGPSGSGKSSLAFDTIYAEGQRRYVESLSAYARQFLEQLPKPDVESIEGLSPAIAIEQRPLPKSPRSTVGTVTEIADYLRLLFARVGTPHCPQCGARIEAQTVQQIVDRILSLGEGVRATLLGPVARARRGELKLELERLRREGFVRVRVDGELVDLGDEIVLDRTKTHDLDVVVDRIVIKDGIKGRVTDSIELALKQGEGRVLVDWQLPPTADGSAPTDPSRVGGEILMSERFACPTCGISLPPIEPRMFSFNGPHGACPACDGIGSRTYVDPERIVADVRKSLRDGAILAWGRRGSVAFATELDRAVQAIGVDPDVAWADLSEATRKALLEGTAAGRKKGAYDGIVARLERLLETGEALDPEDEEDDERSLEADDLGRFVVTRACTSCKGRRLRPEALAVRIAGRNVAELGALSLRSVQAFLKELTRDENALGSRERAIADPLLRAVVARLGFLIDVGLDYLTLDRSAMTLSGGEGQRIRLATQIGAALVGVLYVLDEPSVGLHARDNARLLEALRRLVDLGNSVIVVEHDRDAILSADYLVDMGPRAGVHGGEVVSQGTPAEVMADPKSVTGPWLAGKKELPIPQRRTKPSGRVLRLEGVRTHNLKNATVEVPIGLVTAITGVSGSGKSSLVVDTLLPAVRGALHGSGKAALPDCDAIEGLSHLDKVISIDQAPIGRTPRSNPATYTGVFALLRELYASLPESRARGYKPGRFSFNVKGGRCEACQGDGVLRIEMHFLPDIFVRCETCTGRRYNRETLECLYRGLSIADALDLTVTQAIEMFDALPRVRERLVSLDRVGLGYLELGQPATTLSGGEAQRVKLARELARKATGRTLYVLDEPTTGLHFADIELLLVGLMNLRDAGNTVVVIEHNLDVIACCDWVIDVGPEGGEGGGEVVAVGPPEAVAKVERSHTGRYLRQVLEAHSSAASGGEAAKSRAPRPAAGSGASTRASSAASPAAGASTRASSAANSGANTRASKDSGRGTRPKPAAPPKSKRAR